MPPSFIPNAMENLLWEMKHGVQRVDNGLNVM